MLTHLPQLPLNRTSKYFWLSLSISYVFQRPSCWFSTSTVQRWSPSPTHQESSLPLQKWPRSPAITFLWYPSPQIAVRDVRDRAWPSRRGAIEYLRQWCGNGPADSTWGIGSGGINFCFRQQCDRWYTFCTYLRTLAQKCVCWGRHRTTTPSVQSLSCSFWTPVAWGQRQPRTRWSTSRRGGLLEKRKPSGGTFPLWYWSETIKVFPQWSSIFQLAGPSTSANRSQIAWRPRLSPSRRRGSSYICAAGVLGGLRT